MGGDRAPLRAAAVERRPPVAAILQRSAVSATAAPPVQAFRHRLGNQATQALVSRAIAPKVTPVDSALPPSIQLSKSARLPAKVSKPHEPAELEAEETARKVARMREAPATPAPPGKGAAKGTVQRAEAAPSPATSAPPRSSPVGIRGGTPLPAHVRRYMEPRFGADFGGVRVHTGEPAAHQSAVLGAQAFTVGEHIFFGGGKYQPESSAGRELIAHELTHTIQQGAAVQRSADTTVTQRSEPRVQRLFGVGYALDKIAGWANNIPGFRLLTIVLGVNPINLASVDRSAANILRGVLELIPVVGPMVVQALENHGVFAKVSAWFEGKVRTLGMVGGALKSALDKFLDSLSWSDITDLGGVWERAKRIFTEPIERLVGFGKSLVAEILGFIREAILLPLARLAEGTRGYDLLKAVLGQDPITGQPVPQDAEALLGGFMKFIGEDELWATMQKAKAVPRASAWFRDSVKALRGFVSEIPGLFVQALKSLEIADIILVPRAFLKLAGVFGGFAGRFVAWGAHAVWTLLEIIFDVVSPGALAYIKKTGAALKSILRNPLPFVRNLVRAAKTGFLNFGQHFLEHLKAGLIDWLTGSLPGVYIPRAFSLTEIAKFAFSVLGLTWTNIRQKLVKATNETVVKAMETGFDIVVTLVRDGPAAAWDKIKEQLSNLKDMVIGGITDFVADMVVKKAIPKLIAMFIPGAGFISAILSIYDTIMVFVSKIKQIVQVVTGFLDSIVAIASGAIDAAATRVENALAGVLSLAINFLAGFAGLGKVADKVRAVIEKIRAPIDKALDWLVSWIVKMAKGLFAKGKAAVGKLLRWAFATTTFKDADGQQHTVSVSDKGILTIATTPQAARAFVEWYVKRKGVDPKAAEPIYKLIAEADAIVVAIQKSRAKEDDVPAPGKQRELLGKSTLISELIGKLVSGDRKIGKRKEKYLLEGQVGTYATIPKPVGDQLTPDHQPQASVILAAADFFQGSLGIAGGDLATRAKNRAAQGYAINLHFRRHVAGATYGSKGKTRDAFHAELAKAARGLKKDAAKAKVVELLRVELNKDVKRMKEVAKFDLKDEAWQQLREEAVQDAKKEKVAEKVAVEEAGELRSQIANRIVAGENQIASQPFDF